MASSCVVVLASNVPSEAQDPDDREKLVLEIPHLPSMASIDGLLSEPMWSQAAIATGFVQAEPDEGAKATQPTDVLVYYTTDHLLVGARLHDSEAERIVATEYRRDALLEAEDAFEIFLDTFRDGRNAFYFATNPVGARLDGLIRNEGNDLNFEWDGVWRVAAHRNEDGWTAEIAIPFATLRFRPESSDGWGVNFGRLVARSREESFWAPIRRDWGFNAKWRVSAYGSLRGLENASAGGRVKLKPFAISGAERDYESTDSTGADLNGSLGIDAKVGLAPTLNLDVTWNTDFAQVESDQQQVNLTRFPLFFPEKREFFLENAGLFRVGESFLPFSPPQTLLFFSRQIGLSEDGDEIPIRGGARLTGRLGRTELGAFHIQAKDALVTNDDDETVFVPETGFSAIRLKHDVFERSSFGGMFLSKSPADEGPSNQVAVADFDLRFAESSRVSGFAGRSRTPGLSGSDHAVGAHAEWVRDEASVYADYVDIGDDFNSEMGFVPRTGIRKYHAQAFYSPRPQRLGMRQIFLGNDFTYITNRSGELESQFNSLGPFIVFENGSFLFADWLYSAEGLTEPFEIRDDVEISVGEYRFHRFNVGYNGDQSRRVAFDAFLSAGDFFDGTLSSYNVGVQTKPHPRARFSVFYSRNNVDLPLEGGKFSTNLAVIRGVFAFSSSAFIRALLQINDDENEALANVLFRYNYRPGSDLFVVYNEDRDTAGAGSGPGSAIKHRELIVKLTFYLVPF